MNKIRNLLKNNLLLCEVMASTVLTVGIYYLFEISVTKNYLMVLLFAIAVFAVLHFGLKKYSPRRMKYSLWFAVPFGLVFWFGTKVIYQSTEFKAIGIIDALSIVAVVTLFVFMSIWVLGYIDENGYVTRIKYTDDKWRSWLLCSVVIFVCWLPLFLTFFPGLISVDSAVQIRQAIGEGPMSNWHPVLHTLFLALPINIGSAIFGDLTAGIALSTVVQMLILCAIFGYTILWVFEKTGRKWIKYGLLVFFALYPVVSCYAITMWKDVLFSAVFMLLVMKVYDLVSEKRRLNHVGFYDLWPIMLLAILVAFLRNGGWMIVVMLGLASCIYYKNSRKLISVCFLPSILFVMVVQGPVYGMCGVAGSPFMESMSVPAQQLGYVASQGVLSEEGEEMLSRYADVELLSSNYSPMNADPAKNSFNYEAVDNDKIGFIMMWWRILCDGHLADFAKAYIFQMYAYWNIQSDSWTLDFAHTHDDIWLEADYNDVAILGEGAMTVVEKVYLGAINSVWLGWINNIGVLFWGMIYMTIVFIYKRNYKMLVPMSCVLIYMISLLVASPVSWIFRYVYSLMLILPLLMILCFIKQGRGEQS